MVQPLTVLSSSCGTPCPRLCLKRQWGVSLSGTIFLWQRFPVTDETTPYFPRVCGWMWCCICVCLQKTQREDLLPNPVFSPVWRGREAWCCSQLWHLSTRAKISSKQSVCPAATSLAAAATGNEVPMVIGHLRVQNVCKPTATPTRWGQLLLEIGHKDLKDVGQRRTESLFLETFLPSLSFALSPHAHVAVPCIMGQGRVTSSSQRVSPATCQHLGGETMGDSDPQVHSWGLWLWKITLVGHSHFGELPLTVEGSSRILSLRDWWFSFSPTIHETQNPVLYHEDVRQDGLMVMPSSRICTKWLECLCSLTLKSLMSYYRNRLWWDLCMTQFYLFSK